MSNLYAEYFRHPASFWSALLAMPLDYLHLLVQLEELLAMELVMVVGSIMMNTQTHSITSMESMMTSTTQTLERRELAMRLVT